MCIKTRAIRVSSRVILSQRKTKQQKKETSTIDMHMAAWGWWMGKYMTRWLDSPSGILCPLMMINESEQMALYIARFWFGLSNQHGKWGRDPVSLFSKWLSLFMVCMKYLPFYSLSFARQFVMSGHKFNVYHYILCSEINYYIEEILREMMVTRRHATHYC